MNKHTIVVCGATGNQGLAVCKSLLNTKKWNVVALTRNLNSTKAQQLLQLGAQLAKADTTDQASLIPIFKTAYGVFGVTQPWSPDYKKCDIAGELLQGKNIISACKNAGVQHLVFSSIINLDKQPTGVSHVDSKLQLEEYIQAKGVPFTIIRCAQFMDNIGASFFPIRPGKVKGFIDGKAKVPYTACSDIGNGATRIFEHPEYYLNTTHNLIGDIVSGHELANALTAFQKRPVKYKAVPAILLRWFAPEFYMMRRWFEEMDSGKLLLAAERANQTFQLQTVHNHLAKTFGALKCGSARQAG